MPVKSFEAHMAETGQQSTLDSLRKAGQFDSARSTYEKTGTYGSLPSPTAGGGGSRSSFASAITGDMAAKVGSYDSAINDSRNKLIEYYKGLEAPEARFNRLNEETGLNQQSKLVEALTGRVMQTEDQLDAIPDSVNQRSGDFLMTEGDRTALISRESEPMLRNLTKLLRSKQYEEIGLAGKQNMVSQLLQLSFMGDERGAKPLQLGIDYTTKDRENALQLLSSIANTKISAYDADLDSEETKMASELGYKRQQEMNQLGHKQAIELEGIRSRNDLNNSMTLKNASLKKDAADQATENEWNAILGSPGVKTEYDVWKKIDQNQDTLRRKGVDVDKLWGLHAALAGQVGSGGTVQRKGEGMDPLTQFLLLTSGMPAAGGQ